jgi:2'-5' RNA ligase
MAAKERLKSPRLRLFVALDLPDQFLDLVVGWQAQALAPRRDVRVLPRGSLHVTLVFLAYQAERDVNRIAELSFEKRAEPFELRAHEVVEVPSRRPRLYAIGMADAGADLGRWQAALSERLQSAGLYEPEKRPFWPHLTVARFKSERVAGGRRGRSRSGPVAPAGPVPELPEELRASFDAHRLTLYRSTLKPQGAVYEPLAQRGLGG